MCALFAGTALSQKVAFDDSWGRPGFNVVSQSSQGLEIVYSVPFVMLEDQAGFVNRDKDFKFPLKGQTIGPVEIQEDETLNYYLSLPTIPQGTMLDVDNDGNIDDGVQIFAIAYWSNTWGDPFLEERDGTGWSNAYASTITDPDLDHEIQGGILVVWAPNDEQGFPTGFGEDGLLFTEDDPTASIAAGYNLIDINQEPFNFYKEARPNITLNEGAGAVNNYIDMEYSEAFQAMFEKVSVEYPFTEEKAIDWAALYDEFAPQVADADNQQDFYRAVRDFSNKIPDGHVGLTIDGEVFFEESGGSFGLVGLSEFGHLGSRPGFGAFANGGFFLGGGFLRYGPFRFGFPNDLFLGRLADRFLLSCLAH